MNLTDTNAAYAITFTTLNTGIRKSAKTPCREHRSRTYPTIGFAPTAEQKKKISKILAELLREINPERLGNNDFLIGIHQIIIGHSRDVIGNDARL